MKRSALPVLTAAGLLACLGGLAEAGSVDKTVPFELDKWYELSVTDGPVTLHRFRVARQGGLVTKSKIFRPGNAEYLANVQIEIEYSNAASRDWEAHLRVVWVDEQDQVIDGYNDKENLDEKEHFEAATVSLSTLKYGLQRAKKLKFKVDFNPE